jgi:hypothetical protein
MTTEYGFAFSSHAATLQNVYFMPA